MISDLLTLPCTIISRTRSGDRDKYGNRRTIESTIETVCEMQQTRRDEPASQGELGEATMLLILPPGTTIDTSDAVVVNGHEYELVGPPWAARNPVTGEQHHVEATVVRVAGSEDIGS